MYGLVVTHSFLQREIIWFALVNRITYCSKIMENVNNSGHIFNEDHSSSIFQNSCAGNASEEEKAVGEIREKVNGNGGSRPRKTRSGGLGGYTCCVPGCFNNSKRHSYLSFYSFPDGKSSEKKLLRKR